MTGSWRGHRGKRRVNSRSKMTKSRSRGYMYDVKGGRQEKSSREKRKRRYSSSTRGSHMGGVGNSSGADDCYRSSRYYRAPSWSVRSYPEGENHYTGRVGNILANRYKIVSEV